MWDAISAFVADIVAKIPHTSIWTSFVVCVLLSAGLHNVRFEQDIRASFSPKDSITEKETQVFVQFHNLSRFPQRSFVIFQCKDGGDVLRDEYISEVLRFDNYMTEQIAKLDKPHRRACHPVCSLNKPIYLLLDEIKNNKSDALQFDFPRSSFHDMPLFLGAHLHNVTLTRNRQHPMEARSVVMYYFVQSDLKEDEKVFQALTFDLFKLSKNGTFSPLVNYHIFGDAIANAEMVRGAQQATVLMSIGFVFLLVFTSGVILRQGTLKTTPFLVSATLLTPILATTSSFGLLCWLGYPVYSMQCVTPFLVLGIGVDDAYILIHRWRQRHAVSDPAKRLRTVIVDVGPSITITSLTNIVAFAIGFLTPTPQLSLFCLSTSLALFIDYILTYTALAPIVLLCNSNKEHSTTTNRAAKEIENAVKVYSAFLCSGLGRLLCGLFLIAFYTFSTFGVASMRSTFEPAKAFPSDSPLVDSLKAIKPIFDTYFLVHVFIMSPPNITVPQEHDRFYKLVGELESLPGSIGNGSTLMFLDNYEKFDQKVTTPLSSVFSLFGAESEYRPTLHNLQFFLDTIGNPPTVHYRSSNDSNAEGTLESFSITLLGGGMAEWANRAVFVQSIRKALANYPEFNATLFDGDAAVLSLILTVRSDLIGSIAVTVACMAAICLVFVTNKRGVIVITSVICSICFTLVGCLAWWGSDLDPVTQVDVLLATGFSVDYTAHVAYQFYRSSGNPADRIAASLLEMAEPMVQAGMSTVLCMLPLIFVPTYAIVAFAKTVFLVVGIGLVHGLIVLPVLLGITAPCEKQPKSTRNNVTEPLVQTEKVPIENENNNEEL